MLTLEVSASYYSTIKLDCVNKQVYSSVYYGFYIFASDYDGGNQSMITSGRFRDDILGVFNGSLYLMNEDRSYIKEMHLSNRSYIRSIAVDSNNYLDLIVVHKSQQPLGKL